MIIDGKNISGAAKMNYVGGAIADNILYEIESSNKGKTLIGKWKNPQHNSEGKFEFNLDLENLHFNGSYSTNITEAPNGNLYWKGVKLEY